MNHAIEKLIKFYSNCKLPAQEEQGMYIRELADAVIHLYDKYSELEEQIKEEPPKKDKTGKICPFMSKPLPDQDPGALKHGYYLYRVNCQGKDCALYENCI